MAFLQAAKPGDLSCGTIFAAAVTQLTSENGGSFSLKWIDLGFACEGPLIPLANTILFTDMFETAVYDATTNSCPAGFTLINTGAALYIYERFDSQSWVLLQTCSVAATPCLLMLSHIKPWLHSIYSQKHACLFSHCRLSKSNIMSPGKHIPASACPLFSLVLVDRIAPGLS